MAAAVLNDISPTFLWAGQTTRLRVNGTGINSNAILRIIKSVRRVRGVGLPDLDTRRDECHRRR